MVDSVKVSVKSVNSSRPLTAQSTRNLLIGIWGHLGRRRRLQLLLLLVVMLGSGLVEVLSLGAVLPFLAVLSEPERLWRQPLVQEISIKLGLVSASQLVLPVTMAFAGAAILAALVRLVNIWMSGQLAAAVGSDLSSEAYRRTLYQPYAVHLQRNTAEVIAGTTTQIALTVSALNSFLQLVTSTVVASGLLVGLFLIDASVALGAMALFGTAYAILATTSRRQLRINGQKITEASSKQIKALQEGLNAIRDVLLDGSQSTYFQAYRQADRPQRQLLANNVFLGTFPRYAIEALGMVGIAMLGGLLVSQRGSNVSVIPLLGALALGAQRLLPALQQIYSGWAVLHSHNAALSSVLLMLNQSLPAPTSTAKPLILREGIRLDGVHFSYLSDQPEVLRGLNLEILRGERIGLIGSTGSGKSTTVDILMGLLAPTAGRVLVDEMDLHDPAFPERVAAWRLSIAHVPQRIYLSDSSIAENIAFGVPHQKIDMARVKKAAKQAQIASFIEESPNGYASLVGEQGIRLSGGQRQRIGIARALYKQARVLVFDEATSALDSSTENSVISCLEDLSRDLTLIMIAHRISTLQGCDRVIKIADGQIQLQGPPGQVLHLNP